MTRMVIDALSAALLTRALAREGWTLADFADSMRNAVAGGYTPVRLKQLKRDAMAADFVVGERGGTTQLCAPGVDAFSAPGDCRPMRGVPPMWGSVLRIDGRLELRPNAIRCHPQVVAMPGRATGRYLVTGVELPQTVREAAPGRSLTDILAIAGTDLPPMAVKSIRDARPDDHDRIALRRDGAAPAAITADGIVIAVAAGDPVSVEAG